LNSIHTPLEKETRKRLKRKLLHLDLLLLFQAIIFSNSIEIFGSSSLLGNKKNPNKNNKHFT